MDIDPRFKAARDRAARRSRSQGLRRLWLALAAGGGVAAALAGLFLSGIVTLSPPGTPLDEPDLSLAGDGGEPVAFVSPFVDLPGDPMVLRFDRDTAGERTRTLPRPPELAPDRGVGPLSLLRDTLVTTQERLITTLPSSREDFAFFQSQRDVAPSAIPVGRQPLVERGRETPDVVEVGADIEASWGEALGGDEAATAVSFTRTRIENTTSLAFIRPEGERQAAYEDVTLRVAAPRSLADLLAANGIDRALADRFSAQVEDHSPGIGALEAGAVVALRRVRMDGRLLPVQVSIYTRDSFLGSFARADDGLIGPGADPWVADDLFSFAEGEETGPAATARYRILDAFYSAAMRNGVPSAIVGEAIVMLSQSFDLEAFAEPEDRMALLYSRNPGTAGPGPGQVLYAAVMRSAGRSLECHVLHVPGRDGFSCFRPPDPGQGAGSGRLRDGMVVPVRGVLTSGFGPRMHPVLRIARLHAGVDWAAPTGTPISAAFDGEIVFAGDAGGYGNLVRISHVGGMETRYAHMDRFAPGAVPGTRVRAGDLIGFVGTTGLSTGPHLHFELYQGGAPVDPFAAVGGGILAGTAVEQLVDQIIRVESGGQADARNPLSTATGLGQFIESTWLRMMRTYRPDLAANLTRAELLALRTDPTISREMVQHLAREGEAFLRARGHEVTAGRLYLAHFLGAEGAHVVLSAPESAALIDVLGAAVINANPFLRGRDVAFVRQWADGKMAGRGGRAQVVQRAAPVPPEVLAYQQLIRGLLDQAG